MIASAVVPASHEIRGVPGAGTNGETSAGDLDFTETGSRLLEAVSCVSSQELAKAGRVFIAEGVQELVERVEGLVTEV